MDAAAARVFKYEQNNENVLAGLERQSVFKLETRPRFDHPTASVVNGIRVPQNSNAGQRLLRAHYADASRVLTFA